ncbi:MAG: DUF2961 domain-containing protein, partial [Actinomycetota bacterium]
GFGQPQDYESLVAGMSTAADAMPQGWPHLTELSTLGKPGGISTYAAWPMPFASRAEISLRNTLPPGSPTVEVAYEIEYVPVEVRVDDQQRVWRDGEEVGYFHATEFRNGPPPTGTSPAPHPDRTTNHSFVRLQGRGNYAGHVLNMRSQSFATGGANVPSYMEGDCMFWVDGAPDYVPDVQSTGHEECHDTGAYFQGDENNPTAGITSREIAGDAVFPNAMDETSIFRWWIGDTISFQERFDATVEHGAGDVAIWTGGYEDGVSFYYLGGELPTCGNRRPDLTHVVGSRARDRLRGTGEDEVFCGLGGRDRIAGRGGRDLILGGGGSDVLRGGGGSDMLRGGRGVDRCAGGPGRDRVRACERGRP